MKLDLKKFLFLIPVLFIGLSMIKRHKRNDISCGSASTKIENTIIWSDKKRSEKLWQLHHKHWPIYVIETTKNWAKIVDAYNTTGWVEKKYLSATQYGLILCDTLAIDIKEAEKFIKNHGWPTENSGDVANGIILKQNCSVKLSKNQNLPDHFIIEIKFNFEKRRYVVPKKNVWIKHI